MYVMAARSAGCGVESNVDFALPLSLLQRLSSSVETRVDLVYYK